MKRSGLLMLTVTLLTSALAVDGSRASQADCSQSTQPGVDEVAIVHCLRVGNWVEVRGQLLPNGFFAAERIELRRPRAMPDVWGVAEPGKRGGVLRVLGREIEITNNTTWKGGGPGSFFGQRVRVRARRGVGGKLIAAQVELRDPGVERISGRVDAIHSRVSDGARLEILGFEVALKEQVRQRIEGPGVDSLRSPPQSLRSSASAVVDDDDLFGEGFRFHPSLHFGLQQETSFNSRRNFELDDRFDRDPDDRDDRDDTSHVLRGQLTFSPNPKVTAVVDARHRLRRRDLPSQDAETDSDTRLGEAFVLVRDAGFGLDLQLGRQDYDEPREWLYDQNLDGIRLFRDTRRLHLELSASTTLSDGSTRDQDAKNTIFYLSNRAGKRHFAGYVVHRNFGDFGSERGERQSHVGLRALGPWSDTLRGWAELSYLDGRRADRPVGAWGVDLGLTWQSPGIRRWTITAGMAQGSGDRGGTTDRRFRQTGLQDNDARIGGVTSIRYYGELFDPELSNLRISTLGIGARFLRRSSIELIGHAYRQVVASTRLTNTNLDQRPLGIDRDLGWELDLIVGVRRFDAWSIELVGSHFSQGNAFPDGDNATIVRAQIRYRY